MAASLSPSASASPSAPSDPPALRHLRAELNALAARDLLRTRPAARDGAVADRLNLCSNDYLGYAASGLATRLAGDALGRAWTGAGASRLVAGEHLAHRDLERTIATWLGTEDALVFTSGYAANVGALSALVGPGDLVVSDALNHASLIDGCRLSRAEVVVVPHLDADRVRRALAGSRARRRWVVTESYFSMDGDVPDLRALRRACDDHDAALFVDEAHAVGVFGVEGRGLAHQAGVRPDVFVGTLGKAFGAQGAFVAGSRTLCLWLWNRARSFVFSTGLSPLLARLATSAILAARADEAARVRLHARAAELRAALSDAGADIPIGSKGPIIPVLLGSAARALRVARSLSEAAIDVQPIRPPTVPEGGARLRVTASAALSPDDIARVGVAFRRALRAEAAR